MDTPPPLPPTPTPAPAPGGADERQWAVAIHLSALIGFIVPCGNILGPLIIWLVKKPEMPGLDTVGRTVLNFQISWTIYAFIAGLSIWLCIGVVLVPAVLIAWLVFLILGAVKTSNGEPYQFPLTIKFL
jgi:uncharacterized Tic20 family protein